MSSPDTESLLRSELGTLRTRLEALEAEYAELLADPGVIQEDRDSTRTILEATREMHEAAARAVARFEDGSYGRCVRCGETIAPERLEAIPDVDMCASCAGVGP